MIRLLIANGVDLNARDESGRRLVDLAVAQGLIEFAAILRAHGA